MFCLWLKLKGSCLSKNSISNVLYFDFLYRCTNEQIVDQTALATQYHRTRDATHGVRQQDVTKLTPYWLAHKLIRERNAAIMATDGNLYMPVRNYTVGVRFLPWCFLYDEGTGELTSIITTNYVRFPID